MSELDGGRECGARVALPFAGGAFLGGFVSACQSFLDVQVGDGNVESGSFPSRRHPHRPEEEHQRGVRAEAGDLHSQSAPATPWLRRSRPPCHAAPSLLGCFCRGAAHWLPTLSHDPFLAPILRRSRMAVLHLVASAGSAGLLGASRRCPFVVIHLPLDVDAEGLAGGDAGRHVDHDSALVLFETEWIAARHSLHPLNPFPVRRITMRPEHIKLVLGGNAGPHVGAFQCLGSKDARPSSHPTLLRRAVPCMHGLSGGLRGWPGRNDRELKDVKIADCALPACVPHGIARARASGAARSS